jgi:hypothetical protein
MKSILSWVFVLALSSTLSAADADPVAIGRQLADNSKPADERQALIDKHPSLAAEILIAMGAETKVNTPQEYERIPWIWRVAVAAGKRNDGPEIVEVLKATLPREGEPLRDWQAVVIGGGIVNGIGLTGTAPRARLEELLQSDSEEMLARCHWCLQQSTAMADDVKIKEGTRYDALRIIAMQPWDICGPQLKSYLKPGTSEELQAGAISGSLDVPDLAAFDAVLTHVLTYPPANRDLALDGALRTKLGQKAVLLALLKGHVTREALGPNRLKVLEDAVSSASVQ